MKKAPAGAGAKLIFRHRAGWKNEERTTPRGLILRSSGVGDVEGEQCGAPVI
jgi:hypothetical protein